MRGLADESIRTVSPLEHLQALVHQRLLSARTRACAFAANFARPLPALALHSVFSSVQPCLLSLRPPARICAVGTRARAAVVPALSVRGGKEGGRREGGGEGGREGCRKGGMQKWREGGREGGRDAGSCLGVAHLIENLRL
jgi:hypothetical protein